MIQGACSICRPNWNISKTDKKNFNPNFLKDVSLFLWICLSNKIASCIDDLSGPGCKARTRVHVLRLRLVCPQIPSPWRMRDCVDCWCLLFTSNRAQDHICRARAGVQKSQNCEFDNHQESVFFPMTSPPGTLRPGAVTAGTTGPWPPLQAH